MTFDMLAKQTDCTVAVIIGDGILKKSDSGPSIAQQGSSLETLLLQVTEREKGLKSKFIHIELVIKSTDCTLEATQMSFMKLIR